MKDYQCPSYSDCQLVKSDNIVSNTEQKEKYIKEFCTMDKKCWSQCKRYITKTKLNFCPDFVLPDTSLTPEEIIDKFDNETF